MKDWQKMFESQNDEIEKFDETKQNTAENQKLLKKRFNTVFKINGHKFTHAVYCTP